MDPKDLNAIDRRSFLAGATGLIGTAVSGIGWAATQPCPPPLVRAAGGTSATTSCNLAPGQLPSMTLTSASASGSHGWTFGHAFRQGDVPAGSFVTTAAGGLQADVRNRWPDGSVKFAVLSGVSTFTQNVPNSIALSTTTTAPAGSSVAEPATLDVSVAFSGAVNGTYTLQSCLGINRSTWALGSPGRVRQILGPVMSEFHYYRPTSDTHLTVWFYVRAYVNGAVEVETVVENGWLNVAAPGERDYSVTVNVKGSATYSGSLSHFSHSRWSRVDWYSGGSSTVPQHNAAYLRATHIVPNYGFTNPDSSAYTGLVSSINPVPFALGDYTAAMGNVGYQPAIGLLPLWEALYCTAANSAAYIATIGNARCAGRWCMQYRDETTGRPPLFDTYPHGYPQTRNSYGNSGPAWPAAAGGGQGNSNTVQYWEGPHHPSVGYLAYLIEGRWTHLELLQFAAAYNTFCISITRNVSGYGNAVLACMNVPMTTRGAAWTWRTQGQAAAVSPTSFSVSSLAAADGAMQTQFAASLSNTMSWMNANFITGTLNGGAFKNTIGWIGQYDAIILADWWGASWMVDFQNQALGFISQLGIENLSDQTSFIAVRNFNFLNRILQLGTEATWNFRRGAVYARPYLVGTATSAAPVFYTTAQAFAILKSTDSLTTLTSNAGDPLMDHESNTVMVAGDTSDGGTGYWASALSALAFAVDAGVPGAAAAFSLVTAAPNYAPAAAGANNIPQWAIVPRS